MYLASARLQVAMDEPVTAAVPFSPHHVALNVAHTLVLSLGACTQTHERTEDASISVLCCYATVVVVIT